MRKIAISFFLLLIVPFAGQAYAQDEHETQAASSVQESAKQPEQPVHYYHLDFVVQELGENGKPVNSRTYSCTVSTAHNERDSVRIGSTVPIATESVPIGNGQVNTRFQNYYEDVGVNFDVSEVHEVGGKLAMSLGAELNSFAPVTHLGGTNGPVEPVVHHKNAWHTPILIPIGKSTVVFTSDDMDSKGGMQVIVTAILLQ
jgi:hypothetical protein